jgi:hypothetical protein
LGFGNEVLYSLCRDHPKHDRGDEIIAKVWLIGRSYAVAIERGKSADVANDEFYQTDVIEKMINSDMDEWLFALPDRMTDPWRELGQVVAVHKALMDLFTELTDKRNRSLASKYLHFHRPDLFFLYDSRAKAAAGKASPSIRKIREIKAPVFDGEYLNLVRRCEWITEHVAQRFNALLTPRQLDKMLLRITDRLTKARTSGSTGRANGTPVTRSVRHHP